MKYSLKLSSKEIEENHQRRNERITLYKDKGLDFLKSREFVLNKIHPLQGSILEIGTGTGYTTLSLAKAGYKFTSIDINESSLKTAAMNLAYENLLARVEFYIMNGESLTFANDSFRNIVAVNLFHHIKDAKKVLVEMDRVLCAEGRLILVDFNKKGLELINSVHNTEGHIHEDFGVTKDFINSYLHRLGYEINYFEDTYHWILITKKKIQP